MNQTQDFDICNLEDQELLAEEAALYRGLEPDESSAHYQDWERNR